MLRKEEDAVAVIALKRGGRSVAGGDVAVSRRREQPAVGVAPPGNDAVDV